MDGKGQSIKDLLNSRGLKATHQRMLVYEAMRGLGHASADMVEEKVRALSGASGTGYSLATIYNTLDSLVDVGLLVRRPSFGSKMYFDVNTYDHCHVYDEETDCISDFEDPGLMSVISGYLERKGEKNFKISRVDVQLTGTFNK